jgi:hypothetical protein
LHDENPGGPDKGTRSILLRMMPREPEIRKWHSELPKDKRLAWNHPTSVWTHFYKPERKLPKPEKPRPTTGLTKAEEDQMVEDAQIAALQKRDKKIEQLRDIERELRTEIQRLNAEIYRLNAEIQRLNAELGKP